MRTASLASNWRLLLRVDADGDAGDALRSTAFAPSPLASWKTRRRKGRSISAAPSLAPADKNLHFRRFEQNLRRALPIASLCWKPVAPAQAQIIRPRWAIEKDAQTYVLICRMSDIYRARHTIQGDETGSLLIELLVVIFHHHGPDRPAFSTLMARRMLRVQRMNNMRRSATPRRQATTRRATSCRGFND